jgi:hypothetical protein
MTDPTATSQVKEMNATVAVQERPNMQKSKGKPSRRQKCFIYANLFVKPVTIRVRPRGMEVLLTAFL